MAENAASVNAILDELCEAADTGGDVTVERVTDALGHRGFGPFLIVPALIEISPIGGIPGVPTVLALLILLFAGQIALGRTDMWLPGFLKRRSVSAEKLRWSTEKMRPVAGWLDRWFHERLPRLAGAKATRIAAVVVVLLCLTVPPLELVPFASTAPMAAIALVGLAMMVRDGALMLAAFAASAIGLVVALGAWLGGGGGG